MSTLAEVDQPGNRLHELVSRLVARPLFWLALLAIPAAWPLIWSLKTPVPPKLPVLATLPTFRLTDQAGRPFGSKELEGRAWVASFIFTRCATICPNITAKMTRIQDRTRNLGSAFHLVSFSVDPEFDTPERLQAYARAHHASPRLWSFVTGPEGEVKDAVVNGLKVAMGREKGDDGRYDGIFHGSHLVLVDQRGRVRGYYDSDDVDVVDRVTRDAGLLANRGD
jgi:protein SCO1/2